MGELSEGGEEEGRGFVLTVHVFVRREHKRRECGLGLLGGGGFSHLVLHFL